MATSNFFISSFFINKTEIIFNRYLKKINYKDNYKPVIKIYSKKIYETKKENNLKNKIGYLIPVAETQTGLVFYYYINEKMASLIDNFPENKKYDVTNFSLIKTFSDIIFSLNEYVKSTINPEINFKINQPGLIEINNILSNNNFIYLEFLFKIQGLFETYFYILFEENIFYKIIKLLSGIEISSLNGMNELFKLSDSGELYNYLFNLKLLLNSMNNKQFQFFNNLLIQNGFNIYYFAVMSFLYYENPDNPVMYNLSAKNKNNVISIYNNKIESFKKSDKKKLSQNLDLKIKPIIKKIILENKFKNNYLLTFNKLYQNFYLNKLRNLTYDKTFSDWIKLALDSKRKPLLITRLQNEKYQPLFTELDFNTIQNIFSIKSEKLKSKIKEFEFKSQQLNFEKKIRLKIEIIEFINIITNDVEYFNYYNDKFFKYLNMIDDASVLQKLIRLIDYKHLIKSVININNKNIIDKFSRNMSKTQKKEFLNDMELQKNKYSENHIFKSRKYIVELIEKEISQGRLILEIINNSNN